MPGSFSSTNGCLFSLLAWGGVFFSLISAIISSIISILSKNKAFIVTARVLACFMPLIAIELIASNIFTILDIQKRLPNNQDFSYNIRDAFQYFSPYEYHGYYLLYFPTTIEANGMVRTLQYTTAAMSLACFAALVTLVIRLFISIRKKSPIGWLPVTVLGLGSLATILIYIFA